MNTDKENKTINNNMPEIKAHINGNDNTRSYPIYGSTNTLSPVYCIICHSHIPGRALQEYTIGFAHAHCYYNGTGTCPSCGVNKNQPYRSDMQYCCTNDCYRCHKYVANVTLFKDKQDGLRHAYCNPYD